MTRRPPDRHSDGVRPLTVIVPADPPTLTPRAAIALLRLLRRCSPPASAQATPAEDTTDETGGLVPHVEVGHERAVSSRKG